MSDQWGPTPQQPEPRDPQRGPSWQRPDQGGPQSRGNDPWGTDPYASDNRGTDPYASNPYDSGPYASTPYGADPYAADPYGSAVQRPGAGQPRPSVTFPTAIKLFFKNYAVFRGRASLSEFWWVALFLGLVNLVLQVLTFQLGSADDATLATMLSGVWGLAILIPSLALGTRRLHDTNRSGWWQLIGFLPFIGWIILIVFFAQPSRPEAWQRYDTAEPPASS